jgi:hypothetical protein
MALAKPAYSPRVCRCGGLWSWLLARNQLRDTARAPFFSAKLMQHWRPSHPAYVKLESAIDHDNGPWMISGLITHVSQCFRASHKEATAEAALISDHPVSSAILTDHEHRRARRRFAFCCLSHCMSPDLLERPHYGLTLNRQIVVLRSELILAAEQVVLYGFSISAVTGKRARNLRIEFSPFCDRCPD